MLLLEAVHAFQEIPARKDALGVDEFAVDRI